MLAASSKMTFKYKKFSTENEMILKDEEGVMTGLSSAEKRLKLLSKRRKYSRLEDDSQETVFHDNNNSPTTPPCNRLSAPESVPEGDQVVDPAKTASKSRNVVYFFAIAMFLIFAWRMAISVLETPRMNQPRYRFYFGQEVVLHNLTIDSNMAAMSVPNGSLTLYFCAGNTVVCLEPRERNLTWKRALIHKIENIQCNDAVCLAYGNNTVTALEPKLGGFMWTLRIKAQPFLMTTPWSSRIVVIHNEYIIIYRQDTGRATTHVRIKDCARINRIQAIGARLAVLCQQGSNSTSASLYIIPKSVLLHITSQNHDKPIPADFAGYFKLPVRLHTYNDTVLYILHDNGVVSTLSITERKIEDILSAANETVKDLLAINSTHTLIQTVNELRIYTSRGIVWRKSIKEEDVSHIRRLSHDLVMLKGPHGRLVILDILSKDEACISSVSVQELLFIDGKECGIFIASLKKPNDTAVKSVYYH